MVNFFIVKLPDRPYGKPDTRWWKSGPPVPAERRLDGCFVFAHDMDGRNTKSMNGFFFFLIIASQPPASSWCGLRGKLLEKHQGCKQVEPNAFQPPWNTWLWWFLMLFHLFLKHIPWIWDGRLELYDQGVFGDLRVLRWFSFQQGCFHIPDLPELVHL